ncbi:MAG: barstar family protein [Clostridia bacterium]|nr:barstar family protein [Clostridia bacterium]
MYQFKEKYTIDFTNVKDYLEMHFVIRDALDWPDYYGCNWDAFWDCLTNMVGRPIHIEILGLDVIEQRFDDAAKMMVDTLREFKHYEDDEFIDDIQIEIVSGNIRVPLR